jgi:hypothetical protein
MRASGRPARRAGRPRAHPRVGGGRGGLGRPPRRRDRRTAAHRARLRGRGGRRGPEMARRQRGDVPALPGVGDRGRGGDRAGGLVRAADPGCRQPAAALGPGARRIGRLHRLRPLALPHGGQAAAGPGSGSPGWRPASACCSTTAPAAGGAARLTTAAADILRLPAGRIAPGFDGDLASSTPTPPGRRAAALHNRHRRSPGPVAPCGVGRAHAPAGSHGVRSRPGPRSPGGGRVLRGAR